MRLQQIIISVAAIIAIAVLYQLPKVVVDNDEDSGLSEEPPEAITHSIELPDSVANKITQLRQSMEGASSMNKSSILCGLFSEVVPYL